LLRYLPTNQSSLVQGNRRMALCMLEGVMQDTTATGADPILC
jgi:hypothetical protein